jgi:predicted metal-dependent hydrolase
MHPDVKVIRSKRKTLSLHVAPDKSVIVKVPMRISMREITQFIEKNQEWIEKQRKRVEVLPHTAQKKYQNGEIFLYLGKPHTLEIGNFTAITVTDDTIFFPQFLQFRIQKELTTWYIKQGKEIITSQVEWNAKQMKLNYKSLSFSDTKSRWGSCSHDNHLQFNWRLVMAPLLVIRYVVVHELVHTIEKNHSADFWSRVRYMSPSYKQQQKWLKTHGEILFL